MKCYNYFSYMQAKKLISKKKFTEAYDVLCTLYDDEKNSNLIKNELILLSEILRQDKKLNTTELLDAKNNEIEIKKYSLT